MLPITAARILFERMAGSMITLQNNNSRSFRVSQYLIYHLACKRVCVLQLRGVFSMVLPLYLQHFHFVPRGCFAVCFKDVGCMRNEYVSKNKFRFAVLRYLSQLVE